YLYKKMNMIIMMPYAHKLDNLADWFKQLWAESIGKKYSINGKIINTGSTPIKSLGVKDQHSQLQLYIEGPYDKNILFIHVGKFANEVKIPKQKNTELEYLSGHTLNELMEAEWTSTQYILTKEKRSNAAIHLPEINSFTIGQLIYLLEMQTAIAGELFSVNTYDQPGVEEGKHFTYGMLKRKGYEKNKKEIMTRPEKQKMYII
ncbi:glucose-6-phosphate isomerase, partial [Candidatus Poribacteria bacterium]|nr:glucose-6-phosphate isomerase [Candidatus Poribacteria bacterium]